LRLCISTLKVYAINPKALNRYKDRHGVSKAKTDSLDAPAWHICCGPTATGPNPWSYYWKLVVFWTDFAWI
jgi:hypothetical protein